MRQPKKCGCIYTPNMSSLVSMSNKFGESLCMACIHRNVLCFNVFRAGVMVPQELIKVPRYLNSSTESYGLKLTQSFGSFPLCCRTCIVLIFLALIVSPTASAITTMSDSVLSGSVAGAENAMSST